MRPLTHLEPGQLCLRGTSVRHSSLSSSSLGALLGTEADAHDAADDATDDGAAAADEDDDQDNDASGHAVTGHLENVTALSVAHVAEAIKRGVFTAGLTIAPGSLNVVVAHFQIFKFSF